MPFCLQSSVSTKWVERLNDHQFLTTYCLFNTSWIQPCSPSPQHPCPILPFVDGPSQNHEGEQSIYSRIYSFPHCHICTTKYLSFSSHLASPINCVTLPMLTKTIQLANNDTGSFSCPFLRYFTLLCSFKHISTFCFVLANRSTCNTFNANPVCSMPRGTMLMMSRELTPGARRGGRRVRRLQFWLPSSGPEINSDNHIFTSFVFKSIDYLQDN